MQQGDLTPPEALCGCEWHLPVNGWVTWYLGWSENAGVLFWKTRQPVALQGEVKFAVLLASMLQCTRFAQ